MMKFTVKIGDHTETVETEEYDVLAAAAVGRSAVLTSDVVVIDPFGEQFTHTASECDEWWA